jgi:hypothetical protein
MYDLRNALAIRADNVVKSNPDLAVRYTIYADDRSEWGVLSILNQDDMALGIEFFETEDSWARPGAVQDYYNASDEGYPVAVVIPDNVFDEFRRSTVAQGGYGFSTYLYSDMGIGQTIRV